MKISPSVDHGELGPSSLQLICRQAFGQRGVIERNSFDGRLSVPSTDGFLKLQAQIAVGVVEQL